MTERPDPFVRDPKGGDPIDAPPSSERYATSLNVDDPLIVRICGHCKDVLSVPEGCRYTKYVTKEWQRCCEGTVAEVRFRCPKCKRSTRMEEY